MQKVITKNLGSSEIEELFGQLLGQDPEQVDTTIVTPKYDSLLMLCKDYTNTLLKFVKSPIGSMPEFVGAIGQMVEFIKKSQDLIAQLTLKAKENKLLAGKSLEQINKNPELVQAIMSQVTDKYEKKELGATYQALKNCIIVQEMLMTLRNIRRLLNEEKERTNAKEDNLENPQQLSDKFLVRADGSTITIFGFSSFNFKQFFNVNQDRKMSQYLLLFLRILKLKCEETYKIISSPDIDVAKFSQVLVDSIKNIRKHIPRCDKAFDKIEESVHLLENNFGEYYKDFVVSQNPGLIIENFVLDVAKDSSADVSTTLQFREIIKFYKKHMKKQPNTDPKVQKLFSMLGENLSVLEEKTGAKGKKLNEDGTVSEKSPKKSKEPITEERKEEIKNSFLPDNQKSRKSKK